MAFPGMRRFPTCGIADLRIGSLSAHRFRHINPSPFNPSIQRFMPSRKLHHFFTISSGVTCGKPNEISPLMKTTLKMVKFLRATIQPFDGSGGSEIGARLFLRFQDSTLQPVTLQPCSQQNRTQLYDFTKTGRLDQAVPSTCNNDAILTDSRIFNHLTILTHLTI
ncbi:MAG: hypothetical protein L0Y58_19515 [Verrucomicrobia subdivision 3 bacterium]|nr:hypothetical protein [Limisphaerales bacterium]